MLVSTIALSRRTIDRMVSANRMINTTPPPMKK